jgi:chromosome segregation ATPase
VLSHNYIGTEHILLGLIREGEGVAAQVLVKLGADLNRVRQQVVQLLHGWHSEELETAHTELRLRPAGRSERRLLAALQARVSAIESRVPVIEQRVGTGPDTGDLDRQIDQAHHQREAAADAQEYEQAAALRDRGKQLLAEKAARQQEWSAAHPDLASLAEKCHELNSDIDRLRALLRQHGIDAEERRHDSSSRSEAELDRAAAPVDWRQERRRGPKTAIEKRAGRSWPHSQA